MLIVRYKVRPERMFFEANTSLSCYINIRLAFFAKATILDHQRAKTLELAIGTDVSVAGERIRDQVETSLGHLVREETPVDALMAACCARRFCERRTP